MRGEGVEIRSYGAHVDFFVGYGLSAVYADHGATAMGIGGYLGYGIDGAENIRHVADRHKACPLGKQRAECVHVENTIVVNRHHFQHYACTSFEKLPRHDVGVVLHLREYYLVAGGEEAAV